MPPSAEIPLEEILQASRQQQVIETVRTFYADADSLIAAQQATCWNHGKCCNFGRYGHRLYVTALEVCYYLGTGARPPSVPTDACPDAVGGVCQARDRRPLGCRIFFCDPAAQHWQPALSERFHAKLRRLHAELDVTYFYADWIAVLQALQTAPRPPTTNPGVRAKTSESTWTPPGNRRGSGGRAGPDPG